jgi:type II secretory ATPase GspE/PulE/Tfp pilus assembly ATPase PilB-like protein
VKDQRPLYPLTTCLVSGDELPAESTVEIVVGNRLVRLCCPACEKPLRDEAHRHMKRLDKAVADRQRPDYPLTTCIVAGARLGSMGEPTEMVIAGRLFRFCCASCEPKVNAEPARFIKVLDEARSHNRNGASQR